jgi:glycosyltransferase involved in cell wall biosynthesis
MNPLVSVVIPAYNAIGHIDECIRSVLGQRTALTFEIIAVNDGSTDGTPAKLREIAGVTFLDQVRQGPSAARNLGIRHAQGDFIAFLDSDDLWPEDKLQNQIDVLQQHPDAAMCFGDCRQFEDGRWWSRTLFEEGGYGQASWGAGPYLRDAYARLLENNFITTGSVIARRDVLAALGGFDERLRLVEDLDLWLRIARHHPITWSKEVCLLRRRHEDNISRDADAMSLAYVGVLRGQQASCEGDLPRPGIDYDALIAREYREMAERGLTTGRPGDAMRWAWRSFRTRPSLRAVWALVRGTRHRLGLRESR